MALLRSLFGEEAEILYERDFQALLLANVLGPLGAGVVSPILDSLIDPFAVSAANVGLMISFYTAPPIAIIPIVGALADRYGRKPILVGSLVLFGVAGSAIGFTTDFRVVLLLRLLQGVAFGGITPIIITSIGDIYAANEEATAQGIRFTGSGLSSTVFPLLSGVLVVIAWQYPFFLYAMALPFAVAVYRWFDEPTDADDAATSVADGGDRRSRLHALFLLVRQRRVFAMIVARGLPIFVWIGFLTYNSIIVVQFMDGTPTQAGILVAVGSLTYATAASQAGRITSMFDSRLYPLVGANACLGVGFAIFLFTPFLPIAGVGIAIVGVGFGLTLALYRSIITGLASESLRGSLVSLAEAFGRVTATGTPILMGGVIAVAAPRLGLASAVRVAGLGAAVVAGAGGVICLRLASTSPPVHHEE